MLTTTTIALPVDLIAMLEQVVQQGARRGLLRGAGREGRARAASATTILDDGTCVRVELHHDQAPAVVTHEHGVVVLIPSGGKTHLLDISSVASDPRWDLYRSGALWTERWDWVRLNELEPHGFTATGPRLEPQLAGDLHGTRLEEYLTEHDEGWPGDDSELDLPFETALDWLHQGH